MRIGLDYRPACHGRGGIRVYVRELAAALSVATGDDLFLFASAWSPPTVPACDPPRRAKWRAGRIPGRAWPWFARLGWGVDRWLGGVDVLHWTDFAPLPSSRAAVVATVHDVLFEQLPQAYTPAMRTALRARVRAAVGEAAAFIVPSASAAHGLRQHFSVASERIHVVPHGAPCVPSRAVAAQPGSPYVLCVGTLEPRKNAPRLLEAFRALAHPWRLIWVGPRGWLDEASLEALRSTPRAHYAGAVSAQRLADLYAGAEFVAYPSLGEGFGLPVLEAMAHGKAVLVSEGTAPAEVAGEAGLAVNAHDEASIAAGLHSLAESAELREALGRAALERAALFTWARTAELTRAAYRAACA